MMKSIACVIIILSCTAVVHSQFNWSPPVRITSGESEDGSVAFESKNSPYFGIALDYFAFVRRYPTSGLSNISVMQLSGNGGTPTDTVFTIVEDSIDTNDEPAFASRPYEINPKNHMLVWRHRTQASNLWYSLGSGDGRNNPRSLTDDSHTNSDPCVASWDSGFGLVWVRNGRIAFSEFHDSTWLPPVYVSPEGDTLNTSPHLRYLDLYSANKKPMILWENRAIPDSNRRILYTIYTDTGWSLPNVVTSVGDNRNPKFFKSEIQGLYTISWESNRSGHWRIYSSAGSLNFGWQVQDVLLDFSSGIDESEASFVSLPYIINKSKNEGYFPVFEVGVWKTNTLGQDSVSLAIWSDISKFSAPNPDPHPDISCGSVQFDGIRFWTVWEGEDSGHVKLFASTKVIILGVDDKSMLPKGFDLLQNYPNPFNPSSTIRFILPKSAFVTLKAYNMIGQEIAVLVNEERRMGHYQVEFNGSNHPSGIYFYRLTAGNYSAVRKMVLMK